MAEKIKELISSEEVDLRVRELGAEISKDYEGKTVHMIGILKGPAFSCADWQSILRFR